jgi:hypothetical protein
VANVRQTQTLISHLRDRGVEFALDDFGTGVSSFSYLRMFDVNMLKLDGAFTRDLLTDPRAESLVRGMAQLGRGMNIQTVAECVETQAVRDRLKDLGIDRAQGFFFGQPVPFEQVLAERAAAASILSPAAAEKILSKSETAPDEAPSPDTAGATPLAVTPPLESKPTLVPELERSLPAEATIAAVESPAPVDSGTELEQLARSAEELHAHSQRLKVATIEVAALSEQLARSQEAAGINNEPTIEQPAAELMEHSEPELDQAVLASSQLEPTVEQPIIATG